MSDTIVALFFNNSFELWLVNNPVMAISIAALLFISGYYFWPWILTAFLALRRKRLVWKWHVLRGRKMSKRSRDIDRAERLYDFCLNEINQGRMTHKEKRRFLRNMEMVFELEPGTMAPRPSIHERKRRTLGRLSADAANKIAERASSIVKPLKIRMSIMTRKA